MITVTILIVAALFLLAGVYFVSLGRKSEQIESPKEPISHEATLQKAIDDATRSSISQAIAPVTIETLNSSRSASENLAARSYRIRTIITLFALLVFQVYWLIGATVISDLKDIRARLEKLQEESQVGKAAIAALNDKMRSIRKRRLS